MNHQEVFSELVKTHFVYLPNDFGFSLVEDQYHQSSFACVVAFQNKKRYVKLVWELKDGVFNFAVYRVLSNGKPAPYKDYGANQFYIFALAKHYESKTDMKWLTEMNYYNPELSLLDEKISVNAQLLRKYGEDILAGRQWFDWSKNTLIPEAE